AATTTMTTTATIALLMVTVPMSALLTWLYVTDRRSENAKPTTNRMRTTTAAMSGTSPMRTPMDDALELHADSGSQAPDLSVEPESGGRSGQSRNADAHVWSRIAGRTTTTCSMVAPTFAQVRSVGTRNIDDACDLEVLR